MRILVRVFCLLLILPGACREPVPTPVQVIVVQPLGDFSAQDASKLYKEIKAIYPNTILRSNAQIPVMAWYTPRARYRADSLILWLGRPGRAGSSLSERADTIWIGLTNKDISTTKGTTADWGVMGLGDCPGNACVVSTFRLSPRALDSQLYKVAVHELGHTEGLPHCRDTTCYMLNEEGGNKLNGEKGFCKDCEKYLRKKGWRL